MTLFSSLQLRLLLMAGLLTTATAVHAQALAPASTVSVSATLNSSQQVPTNSSTATGTFTGSVDQTTRVLTYTVTYTGLTPVAAHIHQGRPGATGGVLVPFANVATSPITGTATLTQADMDLLLTGGTYVNVHTAAFGNGEIRGNISAVITGIAPDAARPLLTLTPNPAQETVTLGGLGTFAAPIELLDYLGRVVRTIAPLPTGTTTLDVRHLPAGVYLVRAGAAAQRLVVE